MLFVDFSRLYMLYYNYSNLGGKNMDNNYERKNRIAEALNMRNMKQVDLIEKAGVKKTSLSHWVHQDWQPKQKPLMAMARVLDVSELWLAGYDVPKERPVEQIKTDKLAQLVHRLRKDNGLLNLCINLSELTPDQLFTINSMVNELIKVNSLSNK